ncbi:MAG: Dabb family protein [Firmicutes bacterium]|nr:Dabb family protein [Bacillota bacterium]
MMNAMQHVVLIKFPRDLTQEEHQWINQLLARWPGEIGGISRLHWGTDVSGRSRGYQFGIVMEFVSEEAESRYHPHPLHQEFAQWVAREGGEVLAFDFPLMNG